MAIPSTTNALVLPGNLRFSAGGLPVGDLTGAVLKTIVDNGNDTYNITFQDADGAAGTVTVSATGGGAGASITSGTADPTGGSGGDAYLQVDASSVLQSIWRNVSGTWTEYTLPAGGGGVALSDDAPRSVSTGANAAGTATDASRRDHHHQVPAATTTQAGISERATDAETRTGTSTSRVITPANLTAGMDNRASDVAPAAPTSVASSGTSTDFSRGDHAHIQEGGGTADGTVLNGNGAPAGNSGKDGDTYRDDERVRSWYKKVVWRVECCSIHTGPSRH